MGRGSVVFCTLLRSVPTDLQSSMILILQRRKLRLREKSFSLSHSYRAVDTKQGSQSLTCTPALHPPHWLIVLPFLSKSSSSHVYPTGREIQVTAGLGAVPMLGAGEGIEEKSKGENLFSVHQEENLEAGIQRAGLKAAYLLCHLYSRPAPQAVPGLPP